MRKSFKLLPQVSQEALECGGFSIRLLLGLVVAAGIEISSSAAVPYDFPIVFTQVSASHHHTLSPEAASRLARPDIFQEARVVLLSPDGNLRVMSEGFLSACEPDVSFDAQRILFAGKKQAHSPWAIYEFNLTNGQTRQVSQVRRDCRSPLYLSSLFTLDSPEPWYTMAYVGHDGHLDEWGISPSTSLYSVQLDGSELRQTTFNPGANLDPFQMLDSRLIFSGERYPRTTGPREIRLSLFGMNIDGTELELYGARQGRRIQHMGCATSEGRVVFVEMDAPSWDGAGQLGCIWEHRPHHSYHALTEAPDFAYLYPGDAANEHLFVSRRPSKGDTTSGLYLFNPNTQAAQVVFDSADYHDLQAKPVRPRREPDGRSTVVNLKYDTGLLYTLNCYDADPVMQPHLAKGSLKRLRVIEGVSSSVETNNAPLARRILGDLPIEADGSFNVQIPADIPVELQLLDDQGLALATCGWIWVKQKENRGCIGCHEDPELIPVNAFVDAVRGDSRRLTLPPEKRRAVAFREHVLPILQTRCGSVDCHGGENTPLRLTESAQDETTQRGIQIYRQLTQAPGGYVHAGQARASFLVWQILGSDRSRPWDKRDKTADMRRKKIQQMPPPDKGPALSAAETQTIIEWIDLGAQWSVQPAKPESISNP